MSGFFSSFSGKTNSNSSSSSSINKIDQKIGPVTSEIFVEPPSGCKPTKKHEYDESQLEKIKQLKEYTKSITLPETDPYYPWEQRFLNDPGCHPRFMRAAKWKLEDGKKRIKGTIEWRREYKPELLKPGEIGVEAETGKIILSGFDAEARPILYLRPGRENTKPSDRQIQHLIYHLERAIDLMPPGQEQVAIIVDYASATSASNPSVGTGRRVLNILQNHYVERMGRAVVTNIPWWVNAFFSGITPFMDPITREKIKFNPKMTETFPPAQLDKEYGGEYNLQFDYETYWKTLTEFCHIAPDGGRLDSEGQQTVPPLGNGAKAAYDGLHPHPEAVTSGVVVPADQIFRSSDSPSKLQTNGNGATAISSSQADEEKDVTTEKTISSEGNEEKKDGEEMMVNGVEGLKIQPPTHETAPGAPEGVAVFDHPPSRKEVEIARKSIEVQ